MKKAILILIILSSNIFSQIAISKNDNIKSSVGVGYPGIFFRQHSNDGYIEYIGWVSASKKSQNISFNINKSKYLSRYINDTLDFALSYVYGADIQYKHLSVSSQANSDSFIGASIGLGIETINPQQNGVVVDLFIGEKINYFFEDTSFGINPIIRISLLFNY